MDREGKGNHGRKELHDSDLVADGCEGRGGWRRLYTFEFFVAVDKAFSAGHGHLGSIWETHDVLGVVEGVRLLAAVASAVALLGLGGGFLEARGYDACFSAHLQHRTKVGDSCF